MSNNKHTPGPWICSPVANFSDTLISFIQSGETPVAQLRGLTTGQEEEAKANAKLIAAAPELLEALQAVLMYEKRGADKGEPRIGNGILAIIHTAIKKATE